MSDEPMLSMHEDVESLGVVVVGGGLGIGQLVTENILRYSTARLVVFGLHIVPEVLSLQREYSQRLWILQGDATVEKDRKLALALAMEKLRRVDSLVITTGIMGGIQRLEKLDLGSCRRTFEVNTLSPLFMVQLFLPEIRRTRGRVMILSSTVDRKVKYAGWMEYCASKAALTRAIEILAHEEPAIEVLGIYPGLTKTTMITGIMSGKYSGIMDDTEIQRFRDFDRDGDVEPPEWCATAIAKLALKVEKGGKSGHTQYYYEHVPDCKYGLTSLIESKL